jgi:hypothetical protein
MQVMLQKPGSGRQDTRCKKGKLVENIKLNTYYGVLNEFE